MKKSIIIGILFIFFGANFLPDISSENNIDSTKNMILCDIGPVGYWPFDEGYGNMTSDRSHNKNDGYIYDGEWTKGISGNALSFDGINDYVYIPNDEIINFQNTNSFSLSLWVNKMGSNPLGGECLISKGTGAYHKGYNLFLSKNGCLNFGIRDGTNDYFDNSNSEIKSTGWYHIVLIWDGSSKLYYINGELDKTVNIGSVQIIDDYKALEFGNHWGYTGNNHPFKGKIDEIRMYNRVLTEEEIIELYQNPGHIQKMVFFGKINNLNAAEGSSIIFEAEELKAIKFSPLSILYYSNGESFRISENYLGLITPKYIYAFCNAQL